MGAPLISFSAGVSAGILTDGAGEIKRSGHGPGSMLWHAVPRVLQSPLLEPIATNGDPEWGHDT
jgi:hypothetical protein